MKSSPLLMMAADRLTPLLLLLSLWIFYRGHHEPGGFVVHVGENQKFRNDDVLEPIHDALDVFPLQGDKLLVKLPGVVVNLHEIQTRLHQVFRVRMRDFDIRLPLDPLIDFLENN